MEIEAYETREAILDEIEEIVEDTVRRVIREELANYYWNPPRVDSLINNFRQVRKDSGTID